MPEETSKAPEDNKREADRAARDSRVFIRPLPKIVFLYPTAIAALVCFVGQGAGGPTELSSTFGLIFFLTLALNLPVVAFNFSRLTFVVLVLLVILMAVLKAWTPVFGFLGERQIAATSPFYFWFFALMVAIYLGVFIQTRFDYWELTHNELLHHHGFLGDVDRYPAPGLRITKEVDDVFEFMLLGAGRLVIQPPVEPRAIVLESVPRVNYIEERLKDVLSTLKVTVGNPGL
ncbi:MAG: hypothetical protein O7H41_08915 [Planctomycetota bacterium]|nr:hypothetical protein [Planctomycetota bacterium]